MKAIIFIGIIAFLESSLKAQNLDIDILRNINRYEYPKWDKAMKITSTSIYPVMVLAPSSIFLTGYLKDDKLMMRNGIKTGLAIGLNIALTSGIKFVAHRERPFTQYPNDVTQRVSVGPHSFVSGHTSSAFATATALTLSTKKWYVAVPSYVYAFGVGYSRMRLGVHFPTDILGGMIVGIGSSLLVWQIDKWIKRN